MCDDSWACRAGIITGGSHGTFDRNASHQQHKEKLWIIGGTKPSKGLCVWEEENKTRLEYENGGSYGE